MQNVHITADHKIIREWVEARGGIPCRILDSEAPTEDEGVLEIVFTKNLSKKFVQLNWSDFFKKFDQFHLAFEYEDNHEGEPISKYFKFLWRNGE